MQVLFVYFLVAFTSDYLLKTHKSREYPTLTITVFSFFTILEYILFSLFIYYVLKSTVFKRIIIFTSILFLAFSLWYFFLNIGAPKNFDSPSASIESILIIIFCIFFFFDQINNPEIVMIYESHRFWIVSGFLIYIATELFLFIYAADFTKEQKIYYWNINVFVTILKDIVFGIAIFMKKKNLNLRQPLENSYNL
ncbi:MAG: hypothetical protein QM726_22390 [Chitinophagaceae bacterium]